MQKEGKKADKYSHYSVLNMQTHVHKHAHTRTHTHRLPSLKHGSLQVLQRPRDVCPPQQAAHWWKDDEQHKWVRSKLCNLTVGTVMKSDWALKGQLRRSSTLRSTHTSLASFPMFDSTYVWTPDNTRSELIGPSQGEGPRLLIPATHTHTHTRTLTPPTPNFFSPLGALPHTTAADE